MLRVDEGSSKTTIHERIHMGRLAFNVLVFCGLAAFFLAVPLLPFLIEHYGGEPASTGTWIGCMLATLAIAAVSWPYRLEILDMLTYERCVIFERSSRMVSVQSRNLLATRERKIPFAQIRRVTIKPVVDYGEGATIAPQAVLEIEPKEEVLLHLAAPGGASGAKVQEQARTAEHVARAAQRSINA